MKKLSMLFAVMLSACGGSDNVGTSAPPPETDAYFITVQNVAGNAPDDTEPIAIDSIAATAPDDSEPVAL